MSSEVAPVVVKKRASLVVRALIFAVFWLAFYLLGIGLKFVPSNIMPFWSPGGMMLGILLVAGAGEWIFYFLSAVIVTTIFETGFGHQYIALGLVTVGCAALEAGIGNWVLRRFGGVPSMESTRDLLRLTLVCVGVSAIGSALDYFAMMRLAPDLHLSPLWGLWWSSNMLGLLLFAPLVLAWVNPQKEGSAPQGSAVVAESIAFLVLISIFCFVVFGALSPSPASALRMPFPVLLFPMLLWGSMRLPVRVWTSGMVLIAVISSHALADGGGKFWVDFFGPVRTLIHLQGFLCVSQLCILFSGATVARRRVAESRFKALNENLESSVASRTAELEESRSRYEELAAIAPVGIFRMDAEKEIIYVNEKWCEITGAAADKSAGHGWLTNVHAMDRGRVTEQWEFHGEVRDFEFRFAHPGGSPIWVLAQSTPQFHGGKISGYIGCIIDITARKQAELLLNETREQLETGIRERTAELSQRNDELSRQIAERERIARELLDSESTLRAFFQSAPMMMGIVELMRDDFFFVSVNGAAGSTLMAAGAYPSAGRTARELGWTQEDIEPWLEKFRESEKRRQPMRMRLRRMIGGNEREFAATVSFLGRSAAGQPRYCYVAEDITESARAQETTERFRAILEATTDMVGMADKFGKLFYVNGAGRDLLGLAPDEPLNGLRLPDVHAPWAADLVALEGLPVAMIEGAWQGETAVVSRNGPEIPASELILAHKSPSGSVEFLSTIIRDMSEQKESEVRIKASLEEKEVLLKEIHHRVKNNLQIVSSLLQLQASYIKDNDALQIFEESRDRIKSMALIHEQLYQSNDLAQIDFPEYLRSLLSMVLSAHRSNRTRVDTKLHVDPIQLDLDTAIPIGLITNELVTNSLKYAFAGRSVGEIGVRLTKSETGDFLLMVSDNGVGFPEKFNFDKANSLGLRLVRILSKQMRARLEISNGMGTQFRVYFKSQSPSSAS
jgi:PAS domain S-box-containing protein